MYGKLFASLYQGTLRGQSDAILVFTNMIAFADAEGFVDKHPSAIADETGLTMERVQAAIAILMAPDLESRSPENEGKRLVLIDDHRNWGWVIVNHSKYRNIKSEADRRAQNRESQKRWREKRKQDCLRVSTRKQPSAQVEEEVDANAEAKSSLVASDGEPAMSVDEFVKRWNAIPAAKQLPKIKTLTDKRRSKLRSRLANPEWINQFRESLTHLPLGGDWQPTFDWFVSNDTNALKVAEGSYDNWGKGNGKHDRTDILAKQYQGNE